MRVPDLLLNSVGFIIHRLFADTDGHDDLDYVATGFVVAVPSEEGLNPFFYLVTAAHVVKDLLGKEFAIVFNLKGGRGIKSVETVGRTFICHPKADIAAIQFVADPDLDITYINLSDILTPSTIEEHGIGVGDEVFSIGLFSYAPGRDRNTPLVRHGNIAMFPDEEIQTKMGFADVYLIEARSIGGLSGSPVFARETLTLEASSGETGEKTFICGLGTWRLLGVVQGHWDIKETEINKPYFYHDSVRGVNIGIAIVTPAVKILETLKMRQFAAAREKQLAEYRKHITPSAD